MCVCIVVYIKECERNVKLGPLGHLENLEMMFDLLHHLEEFSYTGRLSRFPICFLPRCLKQPEWPANCINTSQKFTRASLNLFICSHASQDSRGLGYGKHCAQRIPKKVIWQSVFGSRTSSPISRTRRPRWWSLPHPESRWWASPWLDNWVVRWEDAMVDCQAVCSKDLGPVPSQKHESIEIMIIIPVRIAK